MVVFMDGFDSYSSYNDILKRWWGGSLSSPTLPSGRHGGKALDFSGGSIRTNFPTLNSFTAGMAIYLSSSLSSVTNIVHVYDQNDVHIRLKLDYTGKVYLITIDGSNNETILASSPPGKISPNTYHYIEFQVVCSTTATGYAELRVDSEVMGTFSGITIKYNQPQVNSLGLLSSYVIYDDLYITNNTTPNTGFLGDIKVASHSVAGSGRTIEWIPQGTSNPITAISSMDDDSTYLHTAAASGLALFTFSPASTGCTDIKAVQLILTSRKATPGPRTAAGAVGNGSTEYIDTEYGLWDGMYGAKTYIYNTDPITSGNWTTTIFNSRQFGIAAK